MQTAELFKTLLEPLL